MKKTAILFPGQGSQYIGMGKKWYDRYETARKLFDTAEEILGFGLKQLCFEGDMNELTKTANTQPALLTASVAAYQVCIQEYGIEADCMAGHSLGEITALTCAGAIRFEDGVRIVRKRGKLMQAAVKEGFGAMAAVRGLEKAEIEKICGEYTRDQQSVAISNLNSPAQIVISGHLAAVKQAAEKMKDMGAMTIMLPVSAPFHSILMEEVRGQFEQELQKYNYSGLHIPVISNVDADFYQGKESITDHLCRQIVAPVQWQNTMQLLERLNIEVVLEAGPKQVLKNLAKENKLTSRLFALDHEADAEELHRILGDQEGTPARVSKEQKLTLIIRCLAVAVCTRNQNWDNDAYHEGVVVPYKKVQQMLEDLEKEDGEPALAQMQQAMDMLASVFKTKFTPAEEQEERYRQIFEESGTRSLFPDFKMPNAQS